MSHSRSPSSRRFLLVGLALASLAALSGCGALVVGGAATTTAVVATDRRTAGEIVEDKAIEMKISAEMRRLFADTQNLRISPHAYAGQVLLVGDVPTEADKQRAGQASQAVDKVSRVVNELRVGDLTPAGVRANDTWLGSKVRTTLVNTKDVPMRTINVTTERGVVYLQGRVTAEEGERAGIAAASVSGINKVVKLFDIVSPESLQQPATDSPRPAPIEQRDASTTHHSGTTVNSDEVQVLPVQ